MSLELIRLQVMWNRLLAVVEEQAQALVRTAFSSMVRECGDLSAGVFDLRGRMLAQAVTGTPGHVNSMAESVKHFIEHFPLETMREGDIYITNDPWLGTGHLNDFVLTTPAFHRGHLVGLFACTSHLIDIGGIGFGPDGTDVYMEGLYIPMLKLSDGGAIDKTLIELVKTNSRLPIESEGDVYSLAACNDVGCELLSQMMDEFELEDLQTLGDHIVEHSKRAVIENISKLPEGSYSHSMTIDGYDQDIELVATMTIARDYIHVDYEGTSPASRYGINVPAAYTTAYTSFGLSCIITPEIPNNAGSLSPFNVTAPLGSILNAPKPHAVAIRHVIGQMLPDVVFGCLHQAIPDRVPAEGTSALWTLNLRGIPSGNHPDSTFTVSAVTNGGTGGRPTKDGLSATAYPSGVRGTPVEIIESSAPVVVWKKELRPDSGGAGRYRGGLGQEIEIESSQGAPFEILAAFDRIKHAARGRDGGGEGMRGYVGLSSGKLLRGKGFQEVPSLERLIVLTPGGGGVGEPSSRDLKAIRSDLREGLVSKESAERDYGFTEPG